MKIRSAPLAIALLWFIPATLLAQTSTDYLKNIPEDALGFAVVRNISEGNAKLVALAKIVNAPMPGGDPLTVVKKKLGLEKGLDEKGSLVFVVMPGDKEPVGIILVPVTDYKEFVTPLKPKKTDGAITEVDVAGEAHLLAKKGNFAVLAPVKGRAALEKVVTGGKDLSGSMTALQSWIAGNDVAVVLTSSGVKMVSGLMRQGLKKAKEELGQAGAEVQGVLPLFDSLDDLLKAGETDVTQAGLGAQVDKAGNLIVSKRALFAKGSGLSKTFADLTPLEGGPLAGLPAGQFVLAGGGVYPESAAKALLSFSLQMMKAAMPDLTKDKAQKLEQAYGQMAKGLRGMSFVLGVAKEKEPIFSSAVGVMKVDDASAYLAGYEKNLAIVNDLVKDTKLPGAGASTVKKVEVGGAAGLEVTMDLSKSLPGGDAAKGILESFLGEGGKLTTTMVVADPKTVLFGYTKADGLKDFLTAYKQKKGGLAMEADVAKVTTQLPAGSQWAFYLSPQGTMAFAGRVGLPIPLPPFPKTPPVAVGVKLSATGAESALVIPAEVFEGIGKLTQRRAGGN
jgi:hypothetical protein